MIITSCTIDQGNELGKSLYDACQTLLNFEVLQSWQLKLI